MTREEILCLILLCRKKGTDEQFRAWVRKQDSVISGIGDWHDGEKYCEAAHVLRAAESGKAIKSEFACVPLTHREHLIQHNGGEAACLNRYKPRVGGWTPQQAKEWFDEQRILTVERWLND